MELIKRGSGEGVWFDFQGDGAFKVRRIPSGLAKESYFRHFGRKAEVRRKGGAVISETDLDAGTAHTLDLAMYALVDSRNVLVPGDLAPTLEANGDGMTRLDGKWTDEVKRAVLTEVTGLSAWIAERANSLTAQAAAEEDGLGKT